jgi:hypothetical protein
MPLQFAASTYLVTFEMWNSAERCQSEHFKHSSDMWRLQDSANDPTKKSERHVRRGRPQGNSGGPDAINLPPHPMENSEM